MHFNKTLAMTISALLLASSCVSAKPLETIDMQTYIAQSPTDKQYEDIDWVSISEIQKNLPAQPITVGLDIDDTLLFSSPVFYYGQQKYSPNSYAYLKDQDFWNEASTGLDKFSIPKKSAVELVKMHLKHGDTVYFVTGRTAPEGQETLTTMIRNIFPKEYRDQIKPVVFAGGLEKEKQLKAAGITQYYGDSDADITSAQHIGAKGIRFLRNAQSTYTPMPQAGKYGEAVLIDSNY
ncbi:acid phosphatase AphA [Photobacterium nomapromontoriensis]|uniref:acid phosphatase AphA n=1 Tax=Photobacterium nomapromontoriensis TaxID=2910237 RepID=UPI003D0B6915